MPRTARRRIGSTGAGCEAGGVDSRRMPIEIESPEELGYDTITNNLSESSCSDMTLDALGVSGDVSALVLQYGDHRGLPRLRACVAEGLALDDVLITSGAA